MSPPLSLGQHHHAVQLNPIAVVVGCDRVPVHLLLLVELLDRDRGSVVRVVSILGRSGEGRVF